MSPCICTACLGASTGMSLVLLAKEQITGIPRAESSQTPLEPAQLSRGMDFARGTGERGISARLQALIVLCQVDDL